MPVACSALEANWNLTQTSISTVRVRISMCCCWKEQEGKKRPAGKILQMWLTAAGRLPVSRCREQQSEAEKNKSKQISDFVSVSGVEWRLLAVLKGAADRGSQAAAISPCILPRVWLGSRWDMKRNKRKSLHQTRHNQTNPNWTSGKPTKLKWFCT